MNGGAGLSLKSIVLQCSLVPSAASVYGVTSKLCIYHKGMAMHTAANKYQHSTKAWHRSLSCRMFQRCPGYLLHGGKDSPPPMQVPQLHARSHR